MKLSLFIACILALVCVAQANRALLQGGSGLGYGAQFFNPQYWASFYQQAIPYDSECSLPVSPLEALSDTDSLFLSLSLPLLSLRELGQQEHRLHHASHLRTRTPNRSRIDLSPPHVSFGPWRSRRRPSERRPPSQAIHRFFFMHA